jgi:hypothetical protein
VALAVRPLRRYKYAFLTFGRHIACAWKNKNIKNNEIMQLKNSNKKISSYTSTQISLRSKGFLLNEYVKRTQVKIAKQDETCCLLQSKRAHTE